MARRLSMCVRSSGVTRPRIIERPASIYSAASTTSTSPGVGTSDEHRHAIALGRHHLDMLDGVAPGALRDTRHGGGLGGPAFWLSASATIQSAENAAALATHGEDGESRSAYQDVSGPQSYLSFSSLVYDRSDETQARRASRRRCRKPMTAASRTRATPAIPPRRIVDDIGAIEGGAQHGGLGDLAAIAAADAGLIDRGDRIVFQRIVGMFHRQRRAARTGACRRDRRCRHPHRRRNAA